MEDVSLTSFFLPSKVESRECWLIGVTGHIELNFLVCNNPASGYYDLFLQTGSDTPSGKTCSNYQTIHLPCLC
jgi:hypothetical protein